MFPGGGPPAKKDEKLLARKRQGSAATLYKPSIYSYTCRGGYHAYSDYRESSTFRKGSEGICHGFRTRLEMLQEMEPDTRIGALKRFTALTDYEIDEDDAGASALNQQTKSILVSPALIFKDESDDIANDKNTTNIGKKELLPEEELIKRQQWSCYGSTEVDYLVLKDVKTGVQKIAAVAPRNTGLSIRRIEAEEGSSITSIGLGWLNIVVDAGPELEDMDQSDIESKKAAERAEEKIHNDNIIASREEVPPRPSSSSIESAKKAVIKTYAFSGKVLEQMKLNTYWLAENLQDDFPARTLAAGQKIVNQIPKTVDRTANFMNKMYNRLMGYDDGDAEQR